MSISDLVTSFIPDEDPDDSPEVRRHKMRGWRMRLALVACSNFVFTFAVLVPVLVLLLFVGVPMIGQVAWSKDQDAKTDAKIALANKPLGDAIASLTKDKDEQWKILKILATASTRDQLCRYAARRMIEHDVSERYRLLEQIEEQKQRYTEYSGQTFDTADC